MSNFKMSARCILNKNYIILSIVVSVLFSSPQTWAVNSAEQEFNLRLAIRIIELYGKTLIYRQTVNYGAFSAAEKGDSARSVFVVSFHHDYEIRSRVVTNFELLLKSKDGQAFLDSYLNLHKYDKKLPIEEIHQDLILDFQEVQALVVQYRKNHQLDELNSAFYQLALGDPDNMPNPFLDPLDVKSLNDQMSGLKF